MKLGCLPNLPDPMIELCEKNGDECKVCTGSNCNSRPSFIACIDCHTSDDRQCAINPQLAESKTCKYYYDKCYTYIGRFNVSRGCKSDKDKSFNNHCTFNPNKCELCDTINGNGCNNRTIAMETCVECNSGKNPKCRDQPDEFKDKVCSGLKTEDRPGCFLRVASILNHSFLSKKVFKRLSNISILFSTVIIMTEVVFVTYVNLS